MKHHSIIFFILCTGYMNSLRAQGCSDAGACSIESLTPTSSTTEMKNDFSIGLNVGAADHDIFVFGGEVGYTRHFGSSVSVNTRLTFLSQSGNDISESGLGDVFLMANYKPSAIITLSGGVKIPTHKADKTLNNGNVHLPMDYQSSLGTLDLILGVAYQRSNWLLALGYQQPLVQNDNQFYPFEWNHPLADFQNTRDFQRKADVLLRISRIMTLSDKLTLAPGLLPIYHVAEDEFQLGDGSYKKIEGSDGLTLNANLHARYKMGEKSKLGFNIGFPMIVREARPDGLTRSFVAGVEYGLMF